MQRWFGARYELHVFAFEASRASFLSAEAALADISNLRLHHLALVGPDHSGDSVRLYKGGGDGRGSSLLVGRGDDYEVVAAQRLSEVLASEWLRDAAVVLRMNIEGAEPLVIDDLVQSGAYTHIDGYYGMWDDLSKMDPSADDQFRHMLRSYRISPVTFNERDLAFRLRRRAIRVDIETAIRSGLRRRG